MWRIPGHRGKVKFECQKLNSGLPTSTSTTMAVAGPSTPKSKGSSKKEVSKEVIESDAESGSQSGSESADSDDIDEPSAPTPSRKPTSARTNGSAAVLP